jgi:hypothetical protein
MRRSQPQVKGTLTGTAPHAIDAEVECTTAFLPEDPMGIRQDFNFYPDSLKIITAKLEPSLADASPGDSSVPETRYFCVDPDRRSPGLQTDSSLKTAGA